MKPIGGGSQTSIQFERDQIAQPPPYFVRALLLRNRLSGRNLGETAG
jgi:hypothetical protein